MKFCEKIQMHRKKLGLSQEELAARLGVSRQAVSKWEVGSAMPDPSNIVALAKIYGISTDELLMDEPPQQEHQQPSAQNALLDRLPGFLRSLIRRYGWLAGVYTALLGAGFLLISFLSRSSYRSMYGGLSSEITDQIFANSPILTFSTVILILGVILLLGGLTLAIFLYRKRNQ